MSQGEKLNDARFASTFLSILFQPKECTCQLWRHPNDPDNGGLCPWCEDAPVRDLLEALAGDEPPALEDLEGGAWR